MQTINKIKMLINLNKLIKQMMCSHRSYKIYNYYYYNLHL